MTVWYNDLVTSWKTSFTEKSFPEKITKKCMVTLVWRNIPSCSANESLFLGSEFSVSLQATSSGFPLLFFLFFGDTVAAVLEAERKKITYFQYARVIGQLLELNHWKDLTRSCHKWGSYRGRGSLALFMSRKNSGSQITDIKISESWITEMSKYM